MFGMEGTKKKGESKIAKVEFDLEVELRDLAKFKALKEKLEIKVKELKALLREGSDKKSFEDIQKLLHAYLALQKVLGKSSKQQ